MTPEEGPFELARRSADEIRARTGVETHDVALVLGSGWAAAMDTLGFVTADIELSSLPGFAPPRVVGHRDLGRSVTVGSRHVLIFGGRTHLYEGASASAVVHGTRTAIMAGCRVVILTNAAGAIDPALPVGGAVLIRDHLNLTGHSPLVGPEPPSSVPSRFCDLTDAYAPRLRALARDVEPDLPEGTYAGLLGGTYETPAEVAMLGRLGADLVGMSTVLETIAARHLDVDVLGLSLVTNLAAGLAPAALSHDDVLATADASGANLADLIRGVVTHPELL